MKVLAAAWDGTNALAAVCDSVFVLADTSVMSPQKRAIFIIKMYTVGPLIIESFQAKKRVSTGALRALDDPLAVQTKI